MTKLNQIIAIEKSVKSEAHRAETDAYHLIQKAPLLSGISRNYSPKDEDGDRLPPESTLVQVKADQVLNALGEGLTRLFDVVATKETANAKATADVKVDGNTVIANIPVTYLLFLEKELQKISAFVQKLPKLDPSEEWTYDGSKGVYATTPTDTVRSKKVPRNWVKAEATDKHPAQVDVFHEDVMVGTWRTIKYSGALPADRIAELQSRVGKLLDAVKFAREEANSTEVSDVKVGEKVFSYLFKN